MDDYEIEIVESMSSRLCRGACVVANGVGGCAGICISSEPQALDFYNRNKKIALSSGRDWYEIEHFEQQNRKNAPSPPPIATELSKRTPG
jgi:hypothetical protein